jgi:hypothetical protein
VGRGLGILEWLSQKGCPSGRAGGQRKSMGEVKEEEYTGTTVQRRFSLEARRFCAEWGGNAWVSNGQKGRWNC